MKPAWSTISPKIPFSSHHARLISFALYLSALVSVLLDSSSSSSLPPTLFVSSTAAQNPWTILDPPPHHQSAAPQRVHQRRSQLDDVQQKPKKRRPCGPRRPLWCRVGIFYTFALLLAFACSMIGVVFLLLFFPTPPPNERERWGLAITVARAAGDLWDKIIST